MDKKTALNLLETTCQKQFGCEFKEATKQQVYKALCVIVKDILVEKNVEFKNKTNEQTKQNYRCREHIGIFRAMGVTGWTK